MKRRKNTKLRVRSLRIGLSQTLRQCYLFVSRVDRKALYPLMILVIVLPLVPDAWAQGFEHSGRDLLPKFAATPPDSRLALISEQEEKISGANIFRSVGKIFGKKSSVPISIPAPEKTLPTVELFRKMLPPAPNAQNDEIEKMQAAVFPLFKKEPAKTVIPSPSVGNANTSAAKKISELQSQVNTLNALLKNASSASTALRVSPVSTISLATLSAEVATLKEYVSRNVAPPLPYSGTGQSFQTSVSGATVSGGNITLNGNSITTATGDLTFNAAGNTVFADSLTINGVTYAWPVGDGSSGNVLSTDGSGTLSWTSPAGGSGIKVEEGTTAIVTSATNISFGDGKFVVTASGSTEALVTLDWANGPASRAASNLFSAASNQFSNTLEIGTASISSGGLTVAGNTVLTGTSTHTGLATFNGGASISTSLELTTNSRFGINAGAATNTTLEVGGTASISGALTLGSTLGVTGRTDFSTNASLTGSFEITSTLGINAGAATNTTFEVGGTASVSGATTLGNTLTTTGLSTFNGGVSVSTNLEITTNSRLGINAGAATTTTLEVGGTASISGPATFSGGVSLSTSFEITNLSRFGINSGATTTGILEIGDNATTTATVASISATAITSGNIFSIFATTSAFTGNVFRIQAKNLQSGGAVFNISVPASPSVRNVQVLRVTDSAGLVVASMSNGGRLAITGSLRARGAVTNCTGTNSPTGGCIDVAEEFSTTEADLQHGDLVALDMSAGISESVKKATGAYSNQIIGIVTTRPGIILGSNVFIGGDAESYRAPAGKVVIALAGRVPLKVSNTNGDIKKGDLLTSSAVAGVAMKATAAGRVVGMALEDDSDGVVMTFINPHWRSAVPDASTQLSEVIGQTIANGGSVDTQSLAITILEYFKTAIVTVKELIADSVTTKILRSEEGVLIKDKMTGQWHCLQMMNGQLISQPGECGHEGEAVVSPSPQATPTPSSESGSATPPAVSPEPTPDVSPSTSPIPDVVASPTPSEQAVPSELAPPPFEPPTESAPPPATP